jgi:Beta-propeller repeat/Abnormal spindle-like microcephaly-assoc'd, ASPM-SPD-2-Hydin
MKTWGSWTKVVTSVGVTGLVCGLLLLTPFRGAVRRMHQTRAGLSPVPASTAANHSSSNADPMLVEAYGKLPLGFEENQGQTNSEVRFVSHGSGYELFLTPQDAVLALRSSAPQARSARNRLVALRESRNARFAERNSAVRIHLEGANSPRITGVDPLPGKTNYFIGSDPKKWHTDVPSYARVKYADVYPGVDLVFYGNQRRLEYDFVVAPGANPKAIRLNLEGAQKVRLNAQGDMELSVPGGEVILQRPVVYQLVNGERHEIAGSYAVTKGHQVAFNVPNYDRSEPLILDPVLNYSTYLGGTAVDQGWAIAVDGTGNAYVAGATFSTDFPTPAGVKGFKKGLLTSNARGAAFVSEIDPTGTTLLYSSYIAGSTPGEIAQGIAVDSTGKIYLTGQTLSTDFPTSSTIAGLKPGPNAGAAGGTSFIVKLDPAQTGAASLVYSSYLGGTSGDIGEGIAVDTKGNAYVTGLTLSPPGSGGAVTNLADFPVTAGAFQSVLNSPSGNAFLTRIDTTQAGTNSLIYSTYLGGSDVNVLTSQSGVGDIGFGVALDGANNAYIVGTTVSSDFPTTSANAFQSNAPLAITKPPGQNTVFVSRIDTTKSGPASLIYSSYLGGEVLDFAKAIALGPNNVAYVTGSTSSLAFPTFPATPFQTTGHVSGNAFISLIDTGKIGSLSLQYSTYLGGTGDDTGNAIAVDAQGNAYIAGKTSSASDFPIKAGALQPVYPGANSTGFVSKLNPGGNGQADLLYSTYFGGSGGGGANQDEIHAIALDASNPPNVFITGETFSAAKFPIFPAGAFQTSLKGTSDAFVAKLTLIPTLAVSPAPGSTLDFGTVLIPNTSAPQMVTLTNNTNAAIAFTSATLTGANSADFTATPAAACIPSITTTTPCTVSVTFKPSVVGPETATLVLTDGDSTSPQSFTLTGSGTNTAPDFTLKGPTTTQTVKDGSTLTFQVTVTPIGGFKSAVAFTCTGAPALATCTAPSVTPTDGVTPVNSTVTVTTTAMLMPPPSPRTPPVSIRQIVPLVLALLLLFLLPRAQRLRTRLGMATAMILFIALAGCSGAQKPHTPTGPATLTITGTSGALSHPVTVNITVN